MIARMCFYLQVFIIALKVEKSISLYWEGCFQFYWLYFLICLPVSSILFVTLIEKIIELKFEKNESYEIKCFFQVVMTFSLGLILSFFFVMTFISYLREPEDSDKSKLMVIMLTVVSCYLIGIIILTLAGQNSLVLIVSNRISLDIQTHEETQLRNLGAQNNLESQNTLVNNSARANQEKKEPKKKQTVPQFLLKFSANYFKPVTKKEIHIKNFLKDINSNDSKKNQKDTNYKILT